MKKTPFKKKLPVVWLSRKRTPKKRKDFEQPNIPKISFLGKLPPERKAINRYSLKKIAELNAEAPIRIQLCYRAHGIPVEKVEAVYRKGVKYTINRVDCINGQCEICGKFGNLEPHEEPFRSQGGRVSLKDSKMVCRDCHEKRQNNSPIWSE